MNNREVLENEQKILEALLKEDLHLSIDLSEVEIQLKRFDEALVHENERTRKDALDNLKELLHKPKSSKRGRIFGEPIKDIPVPPRILELVNETIFNIQRRLSDNTESNDTKSDNLINEDVE